LKAQHKRDTILAYSLNKNDNQMNNPFTIDVSAVRRIAYTMMAALLVVAGLPMLQPRAHADQLQERYIQMSDSANSNNGVVASGIGSGTNVTYRVGFTSTFAGGGGADSLIIDFCQENPIINDSTCTRPSNMDVSTATLVAVGSNTIAPANNWSVDTAGGSNQQVRLKDTGSNGFTAGTQVFDLTGITNPDNISSFYARIYTYDNNSYGTYSAVNSVGNYVDYGGVALTTVRAITVTARVQEQLTFCITGADPTTWLAAGGGTANECSASEVAASLPAVTLGQGSPQVLDSNNVYTSNLYSQLSTNASSGAVVNLRSNRGTCGTGGPPPGVSLPGGLSADGGTFCNIPPINSGSGAGASAMTAGTAAFGLFVSDGAQGPSGVGSLTATGAYNDGVNVNTASPTTLHFGMDTTTVEAAGTTPKAADGAAGSVISTFGSTLCFTNSPTYRVNTTYVFAATAALTTPAGIYTANMTMVATGIF
jgi:hypothetical protein